MSLEKNGDAIDKLIFEIIHDLGHNSYRPIAADALHLLKTAAEEFMVDVFQKANDIAIQQQRKQLMPKHLRLACSGMSTSLTSSPLVVAKNNRTHTNNGMAPRKAASVCKRTPALLSPMSPVLASIVAPTTPMPLSPTGQFHDLSPTKKLHAAAMGHDGSPPMKRRRINIKSPGPPASAANVLAETLAAWETVPIPAGIMRPWQFILDLNEHDAVDPDLTDEVRAAAQDFLERAKIHGAQSLFLELPVSDQEKYTACSMSQLAAYESWKQRFNPDSDMLVWYEMDGNEKTACIPKEPDQFLLALEKYKTLAMLPGARSVFSRIKLD